MASMPAPDDQRPLKRQRNAHELPPAGQVIDHIFIADGVASGKKAGVKKTPLSCCECRRLKLKCDRNFPCASCKKRGCAEICPEGVLVSGKGTRFILANTEQLHGKIHEMSERIRVLEDALGNVNRKYESHIRRCSSHNDQLSMEDEEDDGIPAHPLLQPELLNVKSTMGLYSGGGSGPTGGNGHKQSPGPSGHRLNGHPMDVDHPSSERGRASSEDTVTVPEAHPREQRFYNGDTSRFGGSSPQLGLSAQVARFSEAFPVSSPLLAYSPEPDPQNPRRKDDYRNLALREYIRGQLPRKEETEYLWEQARRNALWQYNPHSSPTFFPTLINHVYTSSITELCTRRLALLLMILAVGCHVDLNERSGAIANGPQDLERKTQLAEHYHQLGRASLCEIPIMEETNVDVILALFWETWYLLVFSDRKKASGYAWGIMGLTVKLAQSIGLHRNSGKAKVIPEEVDKRRTLFWELLHLDARLSLSLGRPPSLSITHADSPRPTYCPDEGSNPSNSLHLYQEWNHSFYIYCLSPVLEAVAQNKLDISTVLDLDRRVRDFPIPDALRIRTGYESRGLLMQKGAISTALEAVLLQLHRTFFIKAVSGFDEAFNRQHRYAPSVVAVFLSASRMIAAVQDLYKWEPRVTSRILGFWSNAFSSVVALSLLVCRAPFTCLTPAALQELERARTLFRTAKDECPRAMQVLPIMESMIDKANDTYNRWLNGHEIPTLILRHTNDNNQQGYSQQPPADPFAPAHPSLDQCIAEVHERAKILFPLRKPCMCSAAVWKHCPPSHSWAPPPSVSGDQPVLPPEAPVLNTNGTFNNGTHGGSHSNGGYYRHDQQQSYGAHSQAHNYSTAPKGMPSAWGEGLYSRNVLPSDSPALPLPPPISTTLSPSSKMAVVDTLNFDLGAINSSSEQNWMAFF